MSSNYTGALIAIKSAMEVFLPKSIQESSGIIIFTDSRSALQAIQKGKCQINHKSPAHVNILGNEKGDELHKESRVCPHSSNLTTLIHANAVVVTEY
ncbi:hypothetical protein TNCV_4927361 [Trichonephila clavipes]|nr:hypothetical protein TNCV_4927361 [Trichonephila clavipes]